MTARLYRFPTEKVFPPGREPEMVLRIMRQKLQLEDELAAHPTPEQQKRAAETMSRPLLEALAATYDMAGTRKAQDVQNNLCRLRAEKTMMDELYYGR